jgi:hypothetical protein
VSSDRWLVSTLIAIHLIAITAASVPDPRELGLIGSAARQAPPPDALARAVTPVLDATVAALTPVEAQAFRLTTLLRALTRTYIQAGLRQKWNMFSNPVTADQYVRVAHYVESSREPGRIRVFRELALPGQREDRPRLVHLFQDKAILNSLEALAFNRLERHDPERSSELDPVGAYFANRFKAAYLAPDETVVRTEVWFGAAPMPPTGRRLTDSALQERWDVLQRYWDGPDQGPPAATPPQPGALQGDADIAWRLDYVRNR